MIQEANLQWQYQDTDSGLIMPWYTLPALEWLKKQDTKKWYVFEYGCGYSSIWWKINCKFLYSIDHSEQWAKSVGAIHINEEEEYASWITSIDKIKYDCIIIDGIQREKCTVYAIDKLKSGGIIIIDNWDDEDFNPTLVQDLIKHWPIQIFKQPNHRTWQTAILTKP